LALADALESCIAKKEVKFVYYYLNNIIVDPPDSEQCGQCLHIVQSVYNNLGVPLAAEKQARLIEFFGIAIDTVRQELFACLRTNWKA